jgi:hypothetical protein
MVYDLDIIVNKIKESIPSARLLLCPANGHTLYDSYAGSANQFSNIYKVSLVEGKLVYAINEPHALRCYVQVAMNSKLGRSNQDLYSKTTGKRRHYHCARVGSISNPVGVLALSYEF